MPTIGDAVREIEREKRAAEAATHAGTTTTPDKADKPSPGRGDNIKELRSVVDRVVRLTEQKNGLQDDIKTIIAAAKGAGFNPKTVRILVKREMEDADAKAAREAIEHEVDTLTLALGNFIDTPLGESAVSRAR